MRDRIGFVRRSVPWWIQCRAVGLIVLVTVLAAPHAGAGDGEPAKAKNGKADLAIRLKSLAAEVKAHKKAKDYTALDGDLDRAKQLYEDAAGQDKICAQVVDLVGSMAKGPKADVVAPFVLDVLADIGDLRGARFVKPYLRQRDVKVCTSLLQKAVAVAVDLPDASLVEPLLKIVEKSKTYGIAADAIGSLGHFGKCKKKRTKILARLVKTVKKSMPGGRPGMRGGGVDDVSGAGADSPTAVGQDGGPTARWNALSRALPGALSMLTGRDLPQIQDWFQLVKDNKGKLDGFFEED